MFFFYHKLKLQFLFYLLKMQLYVFIARCSENETKHEKKIRTLIREQSGQRCSIFTFAYITSRASFIQKNANPGIMCLQAI